MKFSQEMTVEERLELVERGISELQRDMAICINYLRAIARAMGAFESIKSLDAQLSTGDRETLPDIRNTNE